MNYSCMLKGGKFCNLTLTLQIILQNSQCSLQMCLMILDEAQPNVGPHLVPILIDTQILNLANTCEEN